MTTILLYSKYSQNSMNLLKSLNKNKIQNIILICIDNSQVRDKVKKYINSVPTLLYCDNNGVVESFTEKNLIEWLNTYIPDCFIQETPPIIETKYEKPNISKKPAVLENEEPNSYISTSTSHHINKGEGHDSLASSSISSVTQQTETPLETIPNNEPQIVNIGDEKYPPKDFEDIPKNPNMKKGKIKQTSQQIEEERRAMEEEEAKNKKK